MAHDLLILTFDETHGAQAAMSAVRALEEHDAAWTDDIAIVERHHSGRVATHTTHGSVVGGAAWGGLAGMIVGLLWPPLGFLAWWGAGMGMGALVEKATKDAGLDHAMLERVRDSLGPGQSALIMVGPVGDTEAMEAAFAPYAPVAVQRESLDGPAVDALRDAADRATSGDDDATAAG